MDTPYQTPVANSQPYATASANKKRLKSVSPLQAGIVLGALYAVLGLIGAFFMLPVMLLGGSDNLGPIGVGLGIIIALPIAYGIGGFIGGAICAFVYNIIAKMTGGLEFSFEDVA